MSVVWNNTQVLEFLEFNKNESIKWDPKENNHKNRNLVPDAWKKIVDNFSELNSNKK